MKYLVAIIFLPYLAIAQPDCAFDFLYSSSLSDPILKSHAKSQAIRYAKTISSTSRTIKNIYTIPVVVHILHEGGIENISNEQVIHGIESLNEIFANSGAFFRDEGTDTRLRFCLAKRDTLGQTFDGIIRHSSPLTDMSVYPSHTDLCQVAHYDPKSYLNIRIVKEVCVNNNCKIAGYAVNSGRYTGWYRDGITVEYKYFGSTKPQRNLVPAHEIGHFLGLKHTFHGGCKNDNCLLDGDQVCDTPPDNVKSWWDCNNSPNSCSSDTADVSANNPYRPKSLGGFGDQADQSDNIMDYTAIDCFKRFSQGQAMRMHWFLQNNFYHLASSIACKPPCAESINTSFSVPNEIIANRSITFTNTSSGVAGYQWLVDDQIISSDEHLTHTFSQPGSYKVRLIQTPESSNCEISTFEVCIDVVCPISACMILDSTDTSLFFSYCDTIAHPDSILWGFYSYHDTAISKELLGSILLDPNREIEVCQTVYKGGCSNTICEILDYNPNKVEYCHNEIDDDGDGLIDAFDPDCPCDDQAYQAHCPSDCPPYPPRQDINMRLKWRGAKSSLFTYSNILAFDTSIYYKTTSPTESGSNFKHEIIEINGMTGMVTDSILCEKDLPYENSRTSSCFSFYRQNEKLHFIYPNSKSFISILQKDGSAQHSNPTNLLFNAAISNIADFNADGRPEIYLGNYIFNENGQLLFSDSTLHGKNQANNQSFWGFWPDNSYVSFHSIAANVVGDNSLDLVSGNVVYNLSLNNVTDSTGNSAVKTYAPEGVKDGFSSVGDIDGDGLLDIVVVRNNYYESGGGVWVWNARQNRIIATHVGGECGGVPSIGDINGDCSAEIIITFCDTLRVYSYNGSSELEILYTIPIVEESGVTSVTLFDLNGDMSNEIIYRDESRMFIFNGLSGHIVAEYPIKSRTSLEYPIVADIDRDGEAEILVTGYTDQFGQESLFCFESGGEPWMPARAIWNQYAYNPTFVNDDGTIPRNMQSTTTPLPGYEDCPEATCPTPYNNLLVQATNRTQAGCIVRPRQEADLALSATALCNAHYLDVCTAIKATDTSLLAQGIKVDIYSQDSSLVVHDTIYTSDTCYQVSYDLGLETISIAINGSESSYPPQFDDTDIVECDYSNNLASLAIDGPDLAVDIFDVRCIGDSVQFAIEIRNLGIALQDACVGGGCYWQSPHDFSINGSNQVAPLELTSWCFEIDSTTQAFALIDTFYESIPRPSGTATMWWTVNDSGLPPPYSFDATGIYECNYLNNIDSATFDFSHRILDIGPDRSVCQYQPIHLSAGPNFVSYEWSDLSTDSTYSSADGGWHSVTVTDACGSIQTDSMWLFVDSSFQVEIDDLSAVCELSLPTLSASSSISADSLAWHPASALTCSHCDNPTLTSAQNQTISLVAYKDGCLAVDSLRLTFLSVTLDTINRNICEGDSLLFHNQTITEPGSYTWLDTSACLSETLIVSSILPTTVDSFISICHGDSVLIHSNWIYNTTTETVTLSGENNCDSIIHYHVEVTDILTDTTYFSSLCVGDSILIQDIMVYGDTIFHKDYVSNAGCDSIHTHYISTLPASFDTLDHQICSGDSLFYGGAYLYSSGLHPFVFQNQWGCDSIVNIHLSFFPRLVDTIKHNLCSTDSVKIGSDYYSAPDTIYNYLKNNRGCDSTILHLLSLSHTDTLVENKHLCYGDSILVMNHWVKSEGEYLFSKPSLGSCDSLYIWTISFYQNAISPEVTTNCDLGLVHTSIDSLLVKDVLWSNGIQGYRASYYTEGPAFVDLISNDNCSIHIDFDIPILPSIESVLTFDDTLVPTNEWIDFTTSLDTSWQIEWWNEQGLSLCNGCSKFSHQATQNEMLLVSATHKSGCVLADSVLIRVQNQPEYSYPNIFSPNGDFINDTWNLVLAPEYQLDYVAIYDRWGNLVFSSKTDFRWDGKINGQLGNAGVYIFSARYLDDMGKTQVMHGDITLMR